MHYNACLLELWKMRCPGGAYVIYQIGSLPKLFQTGSLSCQHVCLNPTTPTLQTQMAAIEKTNQSAQVCENGMRDAETGKVIDLKHAGHLG